MDWRWACASVIGTAHVQNGDRLQDAFAVSDLGDGFFFAVVSDGAGSAKFGAYGARILCRLLTVRFQEWARENPALPTDEEFRHWIEELRDRVSLFAARRGTVPRQFAATLAAIFVVSDEVVTLHIGDSAIVGRKGTKWDVLCWPENGEYASSTYFFTDEPEPRLTIARHPSDHDAFAIFSDGVGELALSHLDRSAHAPFFDPMISPVDRDSGKGRLSVLSEKLSTYLGSSLVCERTDDDKTLILISRR